MKLFCAIIIAFLFASAESAQLPPTFKVCKFKSAEFGSCLSSAVEDALKQLKNPIEELDLPSFHPLVITSHQVIPNHHVAEYATEEAIDNLSVYGIMNATVKNFDINFEEKHIMTTLLLDCFEQDLNLTFNGEAFSEQIHFKGTGVGKFYDASITIDAKFTEYENLKEKHIKIVDTQLILKWSRGTFHTESKDEAEAEHMNKLVSAHFKEMFSVVQHDYEKLLALAFTHYANNVFSKVSLKELFDI